MDRGRSQDIRDFAQEDVAIVVLEGCLLLAKTFSVPMLTYNLHVSQFSRQRMEITSTEFAVDMIFLVVITPLLFVL
jgi:hypothetical protein